MTALDSVIVSSRPDPKYCIIWMHGLGADGHDFEAIVPELQLPNLNDFKFIFPHAPIQSVTINNGMQMRAWYDILEMSFDRKVDQAGIKASVDLIHYLIENEINSGVKPENIFLAGFSQGGVIALQTALCYPKKLAGIIALSTYLPEFSQIKNNFNPANSQTPVFMAHGTMDNVVHYDYAKQAYDALLKENYSVNWREYPMPHSVCQEEIRDISSFIIQFSG